MLWGNNLCSTLDEIYKCPWGVCLTAWADFELFSHFSPIFEHVKLILSMQVDATCINPTSQSVRGFFIVHEWLRQLWLLCCRWPAFCNCSVLALWFELFFSLDYCVSLLLSPYLFVHRKWSGCCSFRVVLHTVPSVSPSSVFLLSLSFLGMSCTFPSTSSRTIKGESILENSEGR